MKVLLPAGWPRPKGYANGVTATGRMVFIAGMIGWDSQGEFHTDDIAGQAGLFHQMLRHRLRHRRAADIGSADHQEFGRRGRPQEVQGVTPKIFSLAAAEALARDSTA